MMKTHTIMHQLTRLAMICIFALGGFNARAQVISNPSFEVSPPCPSTFNTGSNYTIPSWSVPTAGTADFFRAGCYLPNPDFTSNTVTAQNGTSFMGIFAEAPISGDYKEYLTSNLATPLVAGVTYNVSFYIRSNNAGTGTGGSPSNGTLPVAERGYFGLMFSSTLPTGTNTTNGGFGSIVNFFAPFGRTYIPASNTAAYTSAAWTLVTLPYTATGGEQYMTVGQFRPGTGSVPAYFYVDNFNFSTASNCKAAGSTMTFTPNTSGVTAGTTTSYILTDAAGVILNTSISPSGFTAPATAGTYNIYSVNYTGTLTGNTVGSNISGVTSDTGCAVKNSASFCVTTTCTPPAVTVNPTNQITCDGVATTFTGDAAGTGLSYRWLFNGLPLSTNYSDNGEYSGANTNTLTIKPNGTYYNGTFSLQITNTCGNVTTTGATLTVANCGGACYNDANMGAGLDTKTGISMLERIAPDSGNWPMIRKSAHTVLESNTKAFVITRMTTAQVNAIVSPQEGMMIYDTDAKCLKINSDGTTAGCSCYDIPACP